MTPRFKSFTALAADAKLVSNNFARPAKTCLASFPQRRCARSTDQGGCSDSADDLDDFDDFGVSENSLVEITKLTA